MIAVICGITAFMESEFVWNLSWRFQRVIIASYAGCAG